MAAPDRAAEGRPDDLTSYLDKDTLIAVWLELHWPGGVQAWEEQSSSAAQRCGLMPISDLHRRVTAVTLVAAREHGYLDLREA